MEIGEGQRVSVCDESARRGAKSGGALSSFHPIPQCIAYLFKKEGHTTHIHAHASLSLAHHLLHSLVMNANENKKGAVWRAFKPQREKKEWQDTQKET